MPKGVKKEGSEISPSSTVTLEKQVALNLVELQKTYTNLAEKFDSLTKQISSLLILFETAAKSFAENPQSGLERDSEFADKVNRLLEQNKLIIKGLELIEGRIGSKSSGEALSTPKAIEQEEFQESQTTQAPQAPQAPQTPPVPAGPVNRPLPRF